MAPDYDHVMLTAQCPACGKEIRAPYGELRITGVFGCICGTMVRARLPGVQQASPLLSGHQGPHRRGH